MIKENPLRTINVTFSNNDLFHISVLVDKTRFLDNKLSNLNINGNEFFMIDLEYKPYESKEWFADNYSWIFRKFYKLLKKEKYEKLIKQCFEEHSEDYNSDYIIKFEQDLITNREDILKLLKSIKKEYNLNLE